MFAGFENFKEWFRGFEGQFVIIGGAACDIVMESEALPFRATKDIDIVLIVEAVTEEFGKRFWQYIKEGAYEHRQKSTGKVQFYRFDSPKSREYPYMIEIFTRKPDGVLLKEESGITPVPLGEEVSSLSAILLDPSYYDLLRNGRIVVDGLPILSAACLIPFKARAWLDLRRRKAAGEAVDGRSVRKHKNDVFRLAQLISADTRQKLSAEITEDMREFLSAMENEDIDLKSMGIRTADKAAVLSLLHKCYGI